MSKKRRKPSRACFVAQEALAAGVRDRLPAETREAMEMMALVESLEELMPVDLERGTVGLNLRSEEDVRRFAEASARIAAWHNKLVAEGKIPGPPVESGGLGHGD